MTRKLKANKPMDSNYQVNEDRTVSQCGYLRCRAYLGRGTKTDRGIHYLDRKLQAIVPCLFPNIFQCCGIVYPIRRTS